MEPADPSGVEPKNAAPGIWPGADLLIEFDIDEPCPLRFEGDPSALLFFMSWAYSLRFGGMHELAQAAMHMQRHHKVDLKPLLTFADHNVEDDDDQFALDHSWQDSVPLATCCRAVIDALQSEDEDLHSFTAEYEPALLPRLHDLAAMSDWGAARGARIRLSFTLALEPD